MDFIREITYRVVPQFAPHNGEIYDQRTIYTLLEVPEAHKALLAYYNDSHVEILEYRSFPFLKENSLNSLGMEDTLEKRVRSYAPLASNAQIKFALKFFKVEVENIISRYMYALGDEKLSEEAWKRIADVNRDLLK